MAKTTINQKMLQEEPELSYADAVRHLREVAGSACRGHSVGLACTGCAQARSLYGLTIRDGEVICDGEPV